MKRMMPLVSEQRREQALRYRHIFGQYCCLRAWLMLRDLLGHDPGEWRYNEYGKPFLTGDDKDTYFSISHCREAIAVAIADQPIGIDVESIRTANEDLIVRVMNETEQAQIHQSAEPDKTFTRLWTEKEAIVKWQGTGIEGLEQMVDVRCTMYDVGCGMSDVGCETIENEKYIYTIIYGKLHCISAEI